MAQHNRHALPVLRRHCDDCRHDRTTYHAGDFTTPPDCDPGCAVLDGDEPAPGAEALRSYTRGEGRTFDHVLERGGWIHGRTPRSRAAGATASRVARKAATPAKRDNQAEADCA